MQTLLFCKRMKYDREILRVLAEAGDRGLTVAKITKHVFNAYNSFFDDVTVEEVYTYTRNFLARHTRHAESVIEHGAGRGIYRIKKDLNPAQQYMLDFKDDDSDEPDANLPAADLSLSLFDF